MIRESFRLAHGVAPHGTPAGMRGTSTRQDTLSALSELLQAAHALTVRLAANPPLGRLLSAFARFPPGDRPALLDTIEREVQARQRSVEIGDGVVGPPNPLASLYIGIYENERPPEITRDTALRSTVTSAALMLAYPEPVRVLLEDAMLAQLGTLEPAGAEALARHYEDLLALAAWSEHCDEAPGAPEA